READLSHADLYGADLSGADLRRANLTAIQGAGLDLKGARLHRANLTDASVAYEAFGGGAPTLEDANLSGATMVDMTLSYVDADGANLTSANMLGSKVSV